MGRIILAKWVGQLWLNELLICSSFQGSPLSDDCWFDRLLLCEVQLLVCIHYVYNEAALQLHKIGGKFHRWGY